MNYKLLVLDLDGTLTNSKKEITPFTRETLLQAQEKECLYRHKPVRISPQGYTDIGVSLRRYT